MDGLDPNVQKFAAVGLLVAVLALSLQWLVLPAISASAAALDQLDDTRARLARLERLAEYDTSDQPEGVLQTHTYAGGEETAAGEVAMFIETAAREHEVEAFVTREGKASDAKVTVAFAGREAQLFALIHNLESRPQLIRFADWDLTADRVNDRIRFAGTAAFVSAP